MGETGITGKGADSGDKEVGKQKISGYVECVMPVSCPSGNSERAVGCEWRSGKRKELKLTIWE